MLNTLMNNLSPQDDDPSPTARRGAEPKSFFSSILNGFVKSKPDTTLRETIEDYIEDDSPDGQNDDQNSQHERLLFSNILQLRDMTVEEVMVPRADIKALESSTPQAEVLKFFGAIQVSRVPVYKENLDHVLGTVHLKDILAALSEGKKVVLEDLVTDVPVVSPTLPVLDLLLQIRQSRRHMVMVVDEYGGIDGLVTMGDVIEAIVGEIDDEHRLQEDVPQMVDTASGAVLADARVYLDEFEESYGSVLSPDEREESDTLGGLVFHIAGRVPARGEIITHDSGMSFEVVDADPRKINRLRIRDIPAFTDDSDSA